MALKSTNILATYMQVIFDGVMDMRNELLRLFGMLIIGVVVLSATQEALALSNNEKIALAKSAAPDFISKNATVLDEDGKLLSQGNNDWVCSPGLPPKYENPMCNDPVWQALMKALNAKKPFSTDTLGFSYMLQGDAPIDNDDPYNTDQTTGAWIKEGPHIMIVGPKGSVDKIPSSFKSGAPYVMFRGTDYEHIMLQISR
ncbi:MAG TPA: hypothetical protein DGQ22_06665 [Rhodobiaceae bacterium]|nr:hypothetical protein [Rhodobiaceae bacterium]